MNGENIATPQNTKARHEEVKTKYPGITVKFETYTNIDYLTILARALLEIDNRIIKNETVKNSCNAYFEVMSRDQGIDKQMVSFKKVWESKQILICFWPEPTASFFAMTVGDYITIAEKNFTKPNAVAWVAGTLVHEFAHWAGANQFSTGAEDALPMCGFRDVYTPGLRG
ncbi:MAG: hypothetical protein P4L82_05975 [Ancalomicrobiaceae bacterium]|nr:hypothetical protein [Ancalomicrobiaceae bacterium]